MDLDATQIIRVRVILHRGIRTITTRVRVVHAFTTKVVNPELSFSCLARIDSNKLDHDNVVLRPRPRSPRRAASPPATADGAGQSPPPADGMFPVYQIDFTAVASGKRIASTKRRVRW